MEPSKGLMILMILSWTVESTPEEPHQIRIKPNNDIHAHFIQGMDITAAMEIADLTIIMDQREVRDTAHAFLKHLDALETWISKEFYNKARESIMDIFREIVDQDEMIDHVNKRNILGPLTLITSALGAIVSTAAIIEAHRNSNEIAELKNELNHKLQMHTDAINNHAIIIESIRNSTMDNYRNIGRLEREIMENKVRIAVKDFRADVRSRSRHIEQLLAGRMDMEIIDDDVVKSAGKLLTKVDKLGYNVFPQLRKWELIHLPFTVGRLEQGVFSVHIHVPIFKKGNIDFMESFRFIGLPWKITNRDNETQLVLPEVEKTENTILVPRNNKATQIYQIVGEEYGSKCTTFRGTKLCPPSDIFKHGFGSTCLGSIFVKDTKGITEECNFRKIDNGEHIVKITNNVFRVSLIDPTQITKKEIKHSKPSVESLGSGIYDMFIPGGAWIQIGGSIIKPVTNHTIINFDVMKTTYGSWNFSDKPILEKSTHEIIREEVAKLDNKPDDFLKPYGGNAMVTSVIGGIAMLGAGIGIVMVIFLCYIWAKPCNCDRKRATEN